MAVKDFIAKKKAAKQAAPSTEVAFEVFRGPKGDKGDPGVTEVKYQELPDDLVTKKELGKILKAAMPISGSVADAPRDGNSYVRSNGAWVVGSGGGGGGPAVWGAITGTLSSQTDVQTALDGKASTSHNHDASYAALGHNHDASYASISHDHTGVYAPVSHAHAISDVTNLTSTLANKSDLGHTHAMSDVTGLTAALAGKSDTGHTHTSADITDFAEAVQDQIGTKIVAGSGISVSYDDASGNTTVTATGGGGADPWTYVTLSSNFSTSSSTAVDITGMSFTPAANKTYEIQGIFMTRTDVNSVGPRVGITWPTGLNDSVIEINASASSSTAVLAYGNDAVERTNLNTGLVNTTSSWPVLIRGLIVVGSSPSGDIQFRLTSETAATNVYVRAGSFFKYREI